MSRLCVKGLPVYLSEDRLRDHFSACGEITDVKIIRTSDGRSRQFGFVGYRSEEEASAAVNYFNRTFIDTSRLTCEIARPVGDHISRPWSRYSKGSSAYEKSHEVSNDAKSSVPRNEHGGLSVKADGKNDENEPGFAEFLQAMQPRSKSKLWANDTLAADEQRAGMSLERSNSRKEMRSSTDNAQRKTKQFPSKDDIEELEVEVLHADHDTDSKIFPSESHNFDRDEVLSDFDYLKQRTKENWSDDDDNDEKENSVNSGSESSSESENGSSLHNDADDNEILKKKMDSAHVITKNNDNQSFDVEEVLGDQQESIVETGRLFVRNLSYATREEDLCELFSKYGELSDVHLVLDKDTKLSKGFAFVLYMLPECAVRARNSLDMKIFQGRLIHVLPARSPPTVPAEDLGNKAKPLGSNQFKQEKEAQRKAAEANGNTQAWNSLFMRSDTVAENIARKFGMSKSELLNPEAEDLAVRLALGETQIIAETKKALRDEGVNVEVLEDLASGKLENVKRSKHVILVKDLPYCTSHAELLAMFGKFGSIERIILPPTKTLALVIYLEPSEARAAMKGLAYRRFKYVPLYLEWAPENILGTSKGQTKNAIRDTPKIESNELKRAVLEQQLTMPTNIETDHDLSESRSVFIKNLSFTTSEASLKKHLQKNLKEGSVCSVTIKMKKKGDEGKEGKLLSRGYGFAEFDSSETAQRACKQLQGTILEGHALVLQLSHTKASEAVSTHVVENKENFTKLLVRNVAFEATKKDLQQLFSPFGQIKSLRLPKKYGGNHRGFAFVEFFTKQEAANAYKALASTHLYGRHLVIEKAKENESLEELRARVAMQYADENDQSIENGKPVKKRKKNLVDDGGIHFEKVAHA
ncbi:hypothetical protein KP509_28G030000 [Ceratopteris richardii]|uniref:RRM domain-containing protein n=1 Tax=Ceratopteris richardii TaxID=49495 RepID=A0A8T2RDE7_CERRI|nr:hypothetical protein KP509_28G030000 [Ceratopteris richardii]KAH7293539.1 hypothetical protein KP509_28G030000 [Ceratopteris richardii]KAH7293540.1 hypothetical protein KP509_28G030000 [Ceratopteris richardii]KAH7293541.1 hypothetical protein KP509_28G030000 [Ceratopteris richardii]KAH7293542.1 hypothetical protein KP509_28G030000 [Ceratopteris richardii]